MRTTIFTLLLLLGFASPAARPAAAAAKATTAPASTGGAEKEVLAALETWRQAMLNKDRVRFEKVLHADLSYGHSSGLIESKSQAIDHVLKSTARYEKVELAETRVKVHGNTAVATGKIDYHQRSNDKVNVIHLVVLSVWLKGPEGWQMIARHATRPPTQTAAPAR